MPRPLAVVVDRPKATVEPTSNSSCPLPAAPEVDRYATFAEPETDTSALAVAEKAAPKAESAIISFFHNNYSFLNY